MTWYLKFWFCNWRAAVWKRAASRLNRRKCRAETRQWYYESEWTLMKNRLKEFPK